MAKTDTDPRAPIVRDWRGVPQYVCPFTATCAYDTLDEQAMTDHLDPVNGKHPVKREPAPPPSAPLSADERANLDALIEENAALKKENSALKGKVTRLENKAAAESDPMAALDAQDDTTATEAASEGA